MILPTINPDCPIPCPNSDLFTKIFEILKYIPDSIFEVDKNGKHIFVQAQNNETPLKSEDMVNKYLHEILPKQIADQALETIQKVIETKEKQEFTYAVPPRDTQSSIRYYQAHVNATSSGTTVVVVRNITKSVEQQQQLQEANQSLTQFASITAHDLREPLIGIAGFASLIQKRYHHLLDEKGNHFLSQILKISKQTEKKLDDLLTFSKVGKEKPLEPFPLGSAIEEAKRSLAKSIAETETEITTSSELPLAQGDRGLVAQVFQNLFSNSIKYRQKDTKPCIRLDVSDFDDFFWKISVSDNGLGFDMQHAEKVFGIFQRLYTIEQFPGTGIGLAVVKKIIEKHGCRIWVKSTPNQGSTFHFTLPKVAVKSTTPP